MVRVVGKRPGRTELRAPDESSLTEVNEGGKFCQCSNHKGRTLWDVWKLLFLTPGGKFSFERAYGHGQLNSELQGGEIGERELARISSC